MATTDTETDWIYYSTQVQGYVEKYTIRGMRDRNRSLLKKLSKAKEPGEGERLRSMLAENNLPLARYTADRFCRKYRYADGDVDDAYQDCCITLFKYISGLDIEAASNPGRFQTQAFLRMYYGLYQQTVGKASFSRSVQTVPFNENDFPVEPATTIDTEELNAVLRLLLPKRTYDIIRDYFYGDPANYIEKGDVDMMSMKYGLTRGRVSQIKEKGIKRVRDILKYDMGHFLSDSPV